MVRRSFNKCTLRPRVIIVRDGVYTSSCSIYTRNRARARARG